VRRISLFSTRVHKYTISSYYHTHVTLYLQHSLSFIHSTSGGAGCNENVDRTCTCKYWEQPNKKIAQEDNMRKRTSTV